MVKSFSNGNGDTLANGPGTPYGEAWRQGWDIRPVTHWDFSVGRTPA